MKRVARHSTRLAFSALFRIHLLFGLVYTKRSYEIMKMKESKTPPKCLLIRFLIWIFLKLLLITLSTSDK